MFHKNRDSDLYITGESYAGVYIPAIAVKIHEKNAQLRQEATARKINLAGVVIGNPGNIRYQQYGFQPDFFRAGGDSVLCPPHFAQNPILRRCFSL